MLLLLLTAALIPEEELKRKIASYSSHFSTKNNTFSLLLSTKMLSKMCTSSRSTSSLLIYLTMDKLFDDGRTLACVRPPPCNKKTAKFYQTLLLASSTW